MSSLKILYVENQARFSSMAVRHFLTEHTVTVVPSLAGAQEALSGGGPFDIVLVDYDLDDGKGTELVRELNNRADKPIVIAVSSHDERNAALLRAGADGVCAKRNFAQLRAIIAALFAAHPVS